MLNISVRKFFGSLLISTILTSFSFQVSADGPWWTAAGSSGVVDEEDTPYVALGGSTPSGFGLLGFEGVARFKSNAPTSSTAAIRYNIPNSPPDGECTEMRVRFRDNGVDAGVFVYLREYSFSNPGFLESAPIRMIFDSNQPEIFPDSDFQEHSVFVRGLNLDFYRNAYFVEARLVKSGQTGSPAVGIIQLDRASVTGVGDSGCEPIEVD